MRKRHGTVFALTSAACKYCTKEPWRFPPTTLKYNLVFTHRKKVVKLSNINDHLPIGSGIKDVALLLNISCRTLRFYETRGLVSPARIGGRRVYSNSDILRLRLIILGKKTGFSLDEIRLLLEGNERIISADSEVSIKQLIGPLSRAKIEQQINGLEKRLYIVEEAIRDLKLKSMTNRILEDVILS